MRSKIRYLRFYFYHRVDSPVGGLWLLLYVFSSFMSIILYDIMFISLRSDIKVYKPIWIPPRLIEMPVPSQENGRSCVCVLGVSILPLSTILLEDFGTLSTPWYFVFVLLHYFININITDSSRKRLLIHLILKYFVWKNKMEIFKINHLYS